MSIGGPEGRAEAKTQEPWTKTGVVLETKES